MDDPQGFTVDSRATGAGRTAMEAFARGWHEEAGHEQPLPAFTTASVTKLRGTVALGRLGDTTLSEATVVSGLRTRALPQHHDHEVRLLAVRRGSMTLDDPDGRGRHLIPAGGFVLQHVRRSVHFETSPGFELQVIALPAEAIAPLLDGRLRAGSIATAEMRLLLSHARSVQHSIADLGQPGRWAVRNTVIELARAVALGRFDQHEPDLAPALVAAARALIDTHLTDPDLSSSTVARQLNVSLRTLQRAFAQTDEPITSYILRRRLESARQALLSAPGLKVAEAAAHWQFSDSSHFVRSFRKLYGLTPGELNRRL